MNFHTFAVCAYKESPYLEECIQSLLKQSDPSEIIVCTSTPNDYIKNTAEKYHLPLFCREGKSDIQDDWNFACEKADSEYVTVAHQDDRYHPEYAKKLKKKLRQYPDTLIAMTDYRIINQNSQDRWEISLLIKQLLKLPLRSPLFAKQRWAKRAALAFGNSVCCPSVCYHKTRIHGKIFQSELKYALDWDTYAALAEKKGRFTYLPSQLFYYRIHDGATSKASLISHQKTEEEILMFGKFWPGWMVKLLIHFYKLSYGSYGKQ
ncbi:MAG: glycosyltransferase family A protein [Eubacteriales bacterium]|nr:glycosyltransferase family A protein [Eubacteriales bacterium]